MNQTGGRSALRLASAAANRVSVTQHLGQQIAHAADAADQARLVRVWLDELAPPHDEVIDGARGWELVGRPGPGQDLIAADGLSAAAGPGAPHRTILVGRGGAAAHTPR